MSNFKKVNPSWKFSKLNSQSGHIILKGCFLWFLTTFVGQYNDQYCANIFNIFHDFGKIEEFH